MRSDAILPLAIALSLLAIIVISGCIDLPTDPDPIVIEGAPRVPAEELQILEVTGTNPLTGRSIGSDALEACFSINSEEGSTLQLERFTLLVPPGALKGNAEICITIPDPGLMICDLKIDPTSANSFQSPLTFSANCTELIEPDQIGALHILCYDEEAAEWKEVLNKDSSLQSMTVQAQLTHFSRYAVVMGKSGW